MKVEAHRRGVSGPRSDSEVFLTAGIAFLNITEQNTEKVDAFIEFYNQ